MLTLEQRVANLEKSLLQMQKNMTPLFAKADETASDVKTITPFTVTKTAYIDDTELIFKDVPSGAWYVSFNNDVTATRVTKDGGTLTVEFDPLEKVTEVTITVQ